MKLDKKALRFYAVTDSSLGDRLLSAVQEALQGGITLLQLREKDKIKCEQQAKQLLPLCKQYNVPLIINDYPDIALSCGADGVHVGQSDGNVSELPSVLIKGVSVQTVKQAMEAEQQGADYLGVGAMFPTSTKPDAITVSIKTLQEICNSVSVPVCAIGGIDNTNVELLNNSGIAGIAVVSALFGAENISLACKNLKASLEVLP